MTYYYDPVERMDDAERADWEVRQHLWAQRRLREVEERGYTRTQLFDAPQNGDRCHRRGCNRPGRLIRLTGDVVCEAHDPLAGPGVPVCCVRDDEELRRCTERDGAWGCTRLEGHGRDHRFSELGG